MSMNHERMTFRRFAGAAGGKIVALTSGLGSMTLMGEMLGMYFYRMSEVVLNMGWRALRTDLKPSGVAVLLVAPGHVDTRMLRESGFRGENGRVRVMAVERDIAVGG